jgi:leader peptidase (prepilin peptidase)/N-methyltransferase
VTEALNIAQFETIFGAILAALFGLAFGSFLNVVLCRLPAGESIISPRSHCRSCSHSLLWWENVPLLSFVWLRGRCRRCGEAIGWRYPATELSVAILWVCVWLRYGLRILPAYSTSSWHVDLVQSIAFAIFTWLLIALAALDLEHFWLPDLFTYPGIALGLLLSLFNAWSLTPARRPFAWLSDLWGHILEALICAALILVIRLVYWLIRRKEGMGLGDAKLMAMLGAWLGLAGALESFALAILGAFLASLVWLLICFARSDTKDWARMPLPFGTFLCLAALSEVFYPSWFSVWWVSRFM